MITPATLNREGYRTDAGLSSGLGTFHGGGHGNPLQYSGLENSMGRGAWQATVHRVARVRHDSSDYSTTSFYIAVVLQGRKSNRKIFEYIKSKISRIW